MLARVCHDLLGTPSIRFKGSMSGVFIDTNDHPLNYHCKRTYFHHASGPLPTKLVHQCHLVHYLDQVCACVRAYVRANTYRYMCIVCLRIPPVGARVRGGVARDIERLDVFQSQDYYSNGNVRKYRSRRSHRRKQEVSDIQD